MCLAVPGRVLTMHGDDPWGRTARVDFGGILKEVELSLVPEAHVGDYVLVHAGFAIARVDEAEALRTLEHLREIDALRGELP